MRRSLSRPAVLLLATSLAASCGGSLRKQQAQRLAEADALFARACYTCLANAFNIYDSLRLAGYQPALLKGKAFDTAILLAMREKELGMAAEQWLDKAASLAPAPASGAVATRAALYLDMARNARWAIGRLDQDEAAAFERATAAGAIASLRDWERALGPPAARDLVGTYLMASLACAYTPPTLQDARLTIEQLAPVYRTTPLMRYAVGSCKFAFRSELQPLADDPDFHEVLFHNGRLRLFEGGTTVHLDARVLLAAAYAAMPDAIANTYLLAGVHSALQEFADCAARYDDVIRHGGAKRESMLQRTVCLTRGAQRQPAIQSATQLIDSPGILRGEAFYYRAWNRYHLKDMQEARADVDRAKPLWISPDVFALSGFIAYNMEQKDLAYDEFGQALRLSPSYCVARFYQGLIDSGREQWAPAADSYEKATTCYARSVRGLELELANVEALELDNPTRQARIENLTLGLDTEKAQLARSAYNAAYSYGRSGNAAKGIPFAIQAAGHKEMEKLATELLEILRKAG